MREPSVVDIVPLRLAGEERGLLLTLRALRELGLNVFKPSSDPSRSPVAAFMQEMTADGAAAMIRACLLHEYTKHGARHGQEPPTVDAVRDALHVQEFYRVIVRVFEAAGLMGGKEETAKTPPDPQTAWGGASCWRCGATTSARVKKHFGAPLQASFWHSSNVSASQPSGPSIRSRASWRSHATWHRTSNTIEHTHRRISCPRKRK